jgi:hypothetical protein
MLLRLGVVSGGPSLSLFDMLLRLGVLSGSPPLSLFDMLLSASKRGVRELDVPFVILLSFWMWVFSYGCPWIVPKKISKIIISFSSLTISSSFY